MSELKTTTVEVNGFPCRVWTKGSGPKVGFLAGLGGLPRWLPFLDVLAKTRTVVVPSLPGYPGGGTGHSVLDTHLDWVLAVRQLLDKAGLAGCDLIGASVGGAFAAEIAAIFPAHVKKLALLAPVAIVTLVMLVVSPVSRKCTPNGAVDVDVRLTVCVLVAVATLLYWSSSCTVMVLDVISARIRKALV